MSILSPVQVPDGLCSPKSATMWSVCMCQKNKWSSEGTVQGHLYLFITKRVLNFNGRCQTLEVLERGSSMFNALYLVTWIHNRIRFEPVAVYNVA